MRNCRVALLAGGMGVRMQRLGHQRSKPLIPFGGSCHLIDFSLDNARRSGAAEVLLMAQHNEQQLVRYLLDSWCAQPGFGIHFGPYHGVRRDDIAERFARIARPQENGTADALIANAPYLFEQGCQDVLVLHADHVYRFDYQAMLDYHRHSGAALTIGYQAIEMEYVKLFGMVEFDADQNLLSFVEKPAAPTVNTVFSAVCIFDAGVLQHYLARLAGTDWQHDVSRDVIPAMLAGGEIIKGYAFPDYWEDIGTVQRYYQANMRLLGPAPTMAPATLPATLAAAPPRYHADQDSLIAVGVQTGAAVTHSLIYPGAQIADSATVRNSIVLPGAVVPPGMVLDHAILLEPGADGVSERIQMEVPA